MDFFFSRISTTYEKFLGTFVYFCSSIINSEAAFLSFSVFLSFFSFLLWEEGGGEERMQNMNFHLMLVFWTLSVIILNFHMWISLIKMSHFPLTNEKLKC